MRRLGPVLGGVWSAALVVAAQLVNAVRGRAVRWAVPLVRVALLAAGLATLGGPAVAVAQPASPEDVARAEELAETARRLYDEGDFAGAVAAYRQAWEVAPTGALLYNIAYIYDRKLALPDVAAEYYQRTLASPDVDPELMRRAIRRLEELRQARSAPALPPAEPLAGAPDGSGVSTQAQWGWAGVGAGAGLFLTGLTLGLVANARQDDFESSRDLATKRDLRDEGRSLAIAGDVLMGVGLAGAIAGTVLLLTDDGAAPEGEGEVTGPTSWRFGVDPVPAGAVLTVGGTL